MDGLPISAWSGKSADAMVQERAERWRLRYERVLAELVEANDMLAELGVE